MPLDLIGFGNPDSDATAEQPRIISDTWAVNPPYQPNVDQPPQLQMPPSDVASRVVCPRCDAEYLPRLVHFACPVCRTPTPGQHARRPPLREDDRLLLIVALATIANVIVLGLLAVAILN